MNTIEVLSTLQLMERLQPMAALPRHHLAQLAVHCTRQTLGRASAPILAQENSRKLVYLVRGEAKLEFSDGSFRVMVGATSETIHPLGRNGEQLLAFKPITEIEILQLDEELLDIMLTWDQLSDPGKKGIPMGTRPGATDRFSVQQLTQGVLAKLPVAHIGELLQRFERIEVKKGQIIVKQDDPGDYYYLIDSGRCTVARSVPGGVIQLADLNSGDAFGEEALVAEVPRNATVTMKTDGVLLRLSKTDFVALLREPLLQWIDWDHARLRVTEGACWVDVRCPAEFQYDGLPGASNVPLNELRRMLPSLEVSKEYLVYCQTGRRSSAAAFLMSQRGLRAMVLTGGLKSCHQSLPGRVFQ